jgi:3-dehydro-L-gulonate 2-dehydrogenase
MTRIPFDELHQALSRALSKLGFTPDRSSRCARLFAETTCDGVYTHGVNRFPRFVATIQNGCVDVHAEPEQIAAFGALERWDGRRGPGNLNASFAMDRAVSLGRQHGIGCVALRNTNHWMRGGSYGWQAAAMGSISLCWTNTLPNLPPWGGIEPCIGNNPLVVAVPRRQGHVVLDMAMSQFSYGALAAYRAKGELLPVDGGYDDAGNLTRDPAAIEDSQRPLPTGYWKGSGLSIMLDMIAATTALGNATHQIPGEPVLESGLSQTFIAIHPAALGSEQELDSIADDIVKSLHSCKPIDDKHPVRYPGERTMQTRIENLQLGVPVEDEVWNQILAI